MACHPRQNVEGLFNSHYYPLFFGEISRETAIQILNEAEKNDGESWDSWGKIMLFLETVSDDIGQNRFAIIRGTIQKDPQDTQPKIHFTEITNLWHWYPGTYVVRNIPFSLEELATVKAATCEFNLETLRLPRMIKEEIKNLNDLNELIKLGFYAPPAPRSPISLLPLLCLQILIWVVAAIFSSASVPQIIWGTIWFLSLFINECMLIN